MISNGLFQVCSKLPKHDIVLAQVPPQFLVLFAGGLILSILVFKFHVLLLEVGLTLSLVLLDVVVGAHVVLVVELLLLLLDVVDHLLL